MKDTRIRYNQRERDVVLAYSVRCFCLSSQQLKAQEMADRFLSNLESITRACQASGPFIYAVHKTRIERLSLGSRSPSDKQLRVVCQDGAAGGMNLNMTSVLAFQFRPSRRIKPAFNSRLRSRLSVRGPVRA